MRIIKRPIELVLVLAMMLSVFAGFGCSSTQSKRFPASDLNLAQRLAVQTNSDETPGTPAVKRANAAPNVMEVGVPSSGVNVEGRTSLNDRVGVELVAARISNTKLTGAQSPAVEVASQVILSDQLMPNGPKPVLTLELLEQMALTQNPALRQAAATINQARGIYQQVGLKPNPTIGYSGQEIGNDGAGGQHGGYVSQTWVRGEKLAWNRQVIAHEVSTSRWQARVQEQRILTDLRVAYYDVVSAQLRLRLAEEFRGVAEEAVELATEKLEAEVGTRPDLLQSEIQLSEIDLVIQRANIDHTAALQQLAALCGVASFGAAKVAGDFEGLLKSTSQLALNEEAILAELYASSPELAVAQAKVKRECANLQRQKRQPIQNVTTQVGVAADDATGDAFANVQVSLPVPVHNKNQGNIRAAAAAYNVAIQDTERIRARLRSDLARAMGEYRIAEAVVENYHKQILPKAQAALELIQQGKDAGEFDFLRVLTARRMYFDSNLQFVSAQARLAQTLARIDGQLLTGGLSQKVNYSGDDGLRGQALGGQ